MRDEREALIMGNGLGLSVVVNMTRIFSFSLSCDSFPSGSTNGGIGVG
jgi:hypothetical protein